MEPMTTAIASELKRLRTERNLSQERLAARADVSQTVVSRYENGRRNPTFSTLAKLAPALGATSFDFGSGRLSPSAVEAVEDDARLRQLCESAITLAQAGADLPPLPMLRQEAQRLGLRNWMLLHDGATPEQPNEPAA